MPDKICESVHCGPVDRQLDKVWASMNQKVPYIVFSLVLGGLLLISIAVAGYFGNSVVKRQDFFVVQQAKTFDTLVEIQKSISSVQGELKHFNGRKRRDGR